MKTKEEILEQPYISPQDLKILMPTMGIENCRATINLIRDEMKDKGLFVPQTTPRLALTKLLKKRFGLWKENLLIASLVKKNIKNISYM